jgi:hypothetical protein
MNIAALPDSVSNAFYVSVGLGAIAVQNLRRHQVELAETVENHLAAALDRIGGQLPEVARDVASQTRAAADEARGHLRGLVARAA